MQKKKDGAAAKKKKGRKLAVRCSFHIIHRNARCLNNVDRFDELLKELEGCKWDAGLLSETWRRE